MYKTHYSEDHPELLKLCGGIMYELCEDFNGLRKSAASSAFSAAELDSVRPPKDYFAIHNIGMGSEESFGENVNADSWSADELAKRAHTFVTHGHFYREHRNGDPRKAIGQIKLAKFDPKMQRVETVLWGHREKAAAEYETAKAGKALSFSMSGTMPYDLCSCCNHKARSPRDYCVHLKKHARQYMPEYKKYAYTRNPNTTFRDMSAVANPADRIARYLSYNFGDDMAKAASVGVITGVEWAKYNGYEDVDVFQPFSLFKAARLRELVEWETQKSAAAEGIWGPIKSSTLETLRVLRPSTLFSELSKAGSILPFEAWAAYSLGRSLEALADDEIVKAAKDKLPGMYKDLETKGDDEETAKMYAADHNLAGIDPGLGADTHKAIKEVNESTSMLPHLLRVRIIHVSMAPHEGDVRKAEPRQAPEQATVVNGRLDKEASALARAYGTYQLQALEDISTYHDLGMAHRALVGNNSLDPL